MTKPLLLWSHWTIASLIVIAISHGAIAPAHADDSLQVEEFPIKTMADNSSRSKTMLYTPHAAAPTLLDQRLTRLQTIRQIQSSGQIWMMAELADQPNATYQEALALTWQDFWQQSDHSIESFNQLLQVHYWRQQA
jgi:hypothetical protein